MTSRDTIFGSIRRSLGVSGREIGRRSDAAFRMRQPPRGVIPARGQRAPRERVALFRTMLEAAAGTTEHVSLLADVPAAVAAFLRKHNLPMQVRRGADQRLTSIPWQKERTLTVKVGPSDGSDLVSVSHAFGGAAETGTLMLLSGVDNPTTLNFLPDSHIVLVSAKDVAGDYETLWLRLRRQFDGAMPRVVNLITGPSRSADIEQTLILGAHGPRRLHVIVVGEPA